MTNIQSPLKNEKNTHFNTKILKYILGKQLRYTLDHIFHTLNTAIFLT